MRTDVSPPHATSASALLSRVTLDGRNWSYVDVGAAAGYSAPPSDGIYVHVVLHGDIRLAGASGGTLMLAAGQVAIVLSGEAHALRTQADAAVTPLPFLREDRAVDVPPTVAIGGPGPVAAHVLSARLTIHWPEGMHRAALAPFLHLDLTDTVAPTALLRPEAFALAGFGAGSSALLTRLAAILLVAGLRDGGGLRAPQTDPIDQALRLIAGNPSAPWSVEQLARNVGMGRSNFAAHFTAKVGRTPMEVIADKRMEQALHLLRQGGFKIAEIAEITGYGSEAAFSRRFARHFGAPPSKMRAAPTTTDTGAAAPSWQPLLPRGPLAGTALQPDTADGAGTAPPHRRSRPFGMGHKQDIAADG